MAGSINKVVLVGNVGRDPEIRHTNAGKKIASFSVATSEFWKDTSGERQEKTEWHRVVIFNPNLAEVVEKYVRKGSKVYVEGSLQTRKWTDNSGVEKYTTEVVLGNFRGELVLLDARGGDAAAPASSIGEAAASGGDAGWDSAAPTGEAKAAPASGGFDDEIPF